MEEKKLQEMGDLAQGETDNGTEPHEEPKESHPYLTRKEVNGLITERLIKFHDALVERGQIPPIRPKTKDK